MALDTAKAAVIYDLTATFDTAVAAAQPLYPRVCTVIESDGADEKYGWVDGMPGVREWIGDRQFKELRAATYEIENKHWESSLLLSKTNLADDRVSMYPPLMQELAAEATHHPDELWFQILENGNSSQCFDGQFFFDTDHEWGDSGTQSNDITCDVTNPAAVTVAEMKSAIRKAVRSLLAFKRPNGKLYHRTSQKPLDDLVVLVPLALRDQAYDAIEAELTGGGNSNVIIDRPEIITSAALSSDVKFYLFRTRQPLNPFVFQAREPLSRMTKGMDDSETKDVKFMTEARYNVGYLAWWNAIACTFTTSE
ncbi:MAG: Mu-like prophage major head subunit gpT family protein [Rubinisphaera brasiliensis]|uniref:Mu-like prophage major head subunit gpT family protein n=1 Tax=Rubinisphaera brasiliensis TaxID=119 RepID=UPI00391C7884